MGRRLAPTIQPYQRTDGTTSYRIRVRVNGRQTTETFESIAAATVFQTRVMDPSVGAARAVALRAREDASSPDYVPTLNEMLTTHLRELTGVEERTKEDYLAIAKRTWLPRLGSLRVDEITRGDVADFVNTATGAPKSIKNAHSVLSAVMESAIHAKHIAHNPARGTRLPRAGEQDEGEMRLLEHAEFDQLYEAVPLHYRPLVLTLFGTGLRWSEATALQVQDFSASKGTLRVVRAWKKQSKGEGSGFKIGPPKTKKSRRTVTLPPELVAVLTEITDGRAGSEWIFLTVTGVVVRHNNFYERIWLASGKRAGLDPRPKIHDARHTHASWLLALGIPIHVVQQRLGHESIQTTVDTYGHLIPDLHVQAAAAASAAFTSTAVRAKELPPADA